MKWLIKMLGGYTEEEVSKDIEREVSKRLAEAQDFNWRRERKTEIDYLKARRDDLVAVCNARRSNKSVIGVAQPRLNSIIAQLLDIEDQTA